MKHSVMYSSVLLTILGVNGVLALKSNDYTGAMVKFNITENGGNLIMPQNLIADNGIYGNVSPLKGSSGYVVQAVSVSDGAHDGCQSNSYSHINFSGPWIALAARGKCSFTKKIDGAAASNASAIVIYEYPDNGHLSLMNHKDSAEIVAVVIAYELGKSISEKLDKGIVATATITPGSKQRKQLGLQRTSIIFVAVSFMILMLVSLAWLVFYYIQRFRIIQAHTRGQRQRRSMTRKAIAKLTTRTVKAGDEALSADVLCAVCIEIYKAGEVIRELPCGHYYHKKCVDPWLESRQTCPMCKINVIKSLWMGDEDLAASNSNHGESVVEVQVVGNVSEPTPVNEPESEQPHHSGSSTVPSESTQLTPVKV